MVFREKGMPKGFWGVVEGCAKFMFPQGEEHMLLTVEEAMVGFGGEGKMRGHV
jgi:hypothetical protein